jgi:hypothetical protein
MTLNEPLIWSHIAPMMDDRGCWEWMGAIGSDGYGKLSRRFQGRKNTLRAHRAVWEMHHGPIPDRHLVCHRCDNLTCVNPAHLFLGLPADNTADMMAKGRGLWRVGDDCPWARIQERDVPEIERLSRSGVPQREIAARFGVGQPHISRIINGRRRMSARQEATHVR